MVAGARVVAATVDAGVEGTLVVPRTGVADVVVVGAAAVVAADTWEVVVVDAPRTVVTVAAPPPFAEQPEASATAATKIVTPYRARIRGS